jgi:8-oxo-dGTP pyrophosphatase MutT (NUDIX family)
MSVNYVAPADHDVKVMIIFAGMEEFLEELGSLLGSELPGEKAQYQMAPGLRIDPGQARYQNAAVLILLYSKEESVFTVLMKRPEYPGAHSGQVSFPGGKHEEGDADLRNTAVREAGEELGIDPERVRVLGELSPLKIPVSGMEVLPVVAHYPAAPDFSPDPAEVDYLIETPLTDLMNPDTRQERIKTILCKLVRVPYYNINGNQVWGATAMILSEFLEIIRKMDRGIPQ